MTEQPMTRREARELERQRAQAAINGQPDLSEPDFTP
ncbi:MAG: hypothetical protein RJA30_537, partial [Actinomycetota bacterium]